MSTGFRPNNDVYKMIATPCPLRIDNNVRKTKRLPQIKIVFQQNEHFLKVPNVTVITNVAQIDLCMFLDEQALFRPFGAF